MNYILSLVGCEKRLSSNEVFNRKCLAYKENRVGKGMGRKVNLEKFLRQKGLLERGVVREGGNGEWEVEGGKGMWQDFVMWGKMVLSGYESGENQERMKGRIAKLYRGIVSLGSEEERKRLLSLVGMYNKHCRDKAILGVDEMEFELEVVKRGGEDVLVDLLVLGYKRLLLKKWADSTGAKESVEYFIFYGMLLNEVFGLGYDIEGMYWGEYVVAFSFEEVIEWVFKQIQVVGLVQYVGNARVFRERHEAGKAEAMGDWMKRWQEGELEVGSEELEKVDKERRMREREYFEGKAKEVLEEKGYLVGEEVLVGDVVMDKEIAWVDSYWKRLGHRWLIMPRVVGGLRRVMSLSQAETVGCILFLFMEIIFLSMIIKGIYGGYRFLWG